MELPSVDHHLQQMMACIQKNKFNGSEQHLGKQKPISSRLKVSLGVRFVFDNLGHTMDKDGCSRTNV
jgi:hypothetical protein